MLGLTAIAAAVPTEQELLRRGTVVLDDADPKARMLFGDNAKRSVMKEVSVEGQPFSRAIEVDNGGKSADPNDVQLAIRTSKAIKSGDVIWIQFYGRATKARAETGEASIGMAFLIGPGFNSPFQRTIGPGPQWERYDFRFVATRDVAAGVGALRLQLGYDAQTIQIGGLRLLDLGNSAPLESVPETAATYQGREPDATWRKQAAERIEKLRKGELTVIVTDSAGKPVDSAMVHVALKRRAFEFGCIGNSRLTWGDKAQTDDGRHFQQTFLGLFNRASIGQVTWRWWENPGLRQMQVKDIEWFHAHGIAELHGSHLMWAKWRRIPTTSGKFSGNYKGIDWASTRGDDDSDAALAEYQAHVKADGADTAREWLRQRIHAHITEAMSAMAGTFQSWNVVNEHYSEHVLTDILGMDEMVEWFRLAHATDPAARLIINDAGVIGPDRDHEDAYCETIRFLLDKGAPLHVIGEESHFGYRLPPPTQVLRILDRLAAFGLPIEITEFDVDTPDEQLQADYTRDYLTLAFSHPAVRAITLWGFWQGDHWVPHGGLWRKDWTIKPAGRVFEDLLTKQWWTDLTGRTDGTGVFHTRGFLGDYEIEATAGRKTAKVKGSLVKQGATVTIELR